MAEPQSNPNNSEIKPPESGHAYRVIAYISSSLLLLLVGAAGFWFYQQKLLKPTASIMPSVATPPETILPSTAEPSFIPSIPPSITPGPQLPSPSPAKSALQAIKEAFAKKYNKQVADVNVTISKNDGTHTSGGVTFSGEMGGGWWLAYNDGGNWIIVQDGNGTVSCETIQPYNFPSIMVPECVNQAGNLIKR